MHGRLLVLDAVMRLAFVLAALSSALGCGPIGPGASNRPAPTTSYSPSSGGGGGGSGGGYTSVYDDKGCAKAAGDSGSKLQAQCRAGK